MLRIRMSTAADTEALATVFEAMQAHYGAECPARAVIVHDLDNLPTGVDVLLADDEGIVGFAAVGAIYPGPALTSGLFLKDLFVSKTYRGRGAGRLLMRACAALALERGHQRLEFTADRNNARLIAYYEDQGAVQRAEKAFYRFDIAGLQRLAGAEGA